MECWYRNGRVRGGRSRAATRLVATIVRFANGFKAASTPLDILQRRNISANSAGKAVLERESEIWRISCWIIILQEVGTAGSFKLGFILREQRKFACAH